VLHAHVQKYIGKRECMQFKTPEHTCNTILSKRTILWGPCNKSGDQTM